MATSLHAVASAAALILRAGIAAATAGVAAWRLYRLSYLAEDKKKQNSLHRAVLNGETDSIRRILACCPAAAAARDVDGCVPLHLACYHGRPVEVVELLLAAALGTAAAFTARRYTPLHLACFSKLSTAEVVELLLAAAPGTAAAVNVAGQTPLHVACWQSPPSPGLVRLLLATAPSTATVVDARSRTPLHLACNSQELQGTAEVVELLLRAAPGAATAQGSSGDTPLHVAAMRGQLAAATAILQASSAAAVVQNAAGRLPLHLACMGGHSDVAGALLAAAPRTATMADPSGVQPLHLAAAYGRASVVPLFSAVPAATVARGADDATPLFLAAQNGHAETVAILLAVAPAAAGIGMSHLQLLPMHAAAWCGQEAVVRLLSVAAPETAVVTSSRGHTPLQLALDQQNISCARCLLGAGPAADVLHALSNASDPALPLFADFIIARPALTAEQWALVPTPCPGLGTALPAVLARSFEQAARLAAHLPADDLARLSTAALCLLRLQRTLGLSATVPAPAVQCVLAACLG